MSSLASIDRERVREQILLRPLVATTADRPTGWHSRQTRQSPRLWQQHLVYFDWQQHWSSVKALFERNVSVRWAACQHISGWNGNRRCCSEKWGTAFTRWPPSCGPGPTIRAMSDAPKFFPLLLQCDSCDLGGNGCESAELAFSIMPDAMAAELLQRQQVELSAVMDDEYWDEDAVFQIGRYYECECQNWLESELDDSRLLSTGLMPMHAGLMPLMFRLAQLLAPHGAVLELRVAPRPTGDKLARLEAMRDPGLTVMVEDSWTDAAAVDVTNQVVYTLAPDYFQRSCPPAAAFIEGKELVRRWCKDGGIPPRAYAWLRFRRDLPLEVVRMVQARLEGTETMDIPRWLDYADATKTNWCEPRELRHLCEAVRCLQSACVLPLVSCRRACHPGHGHTAACDVQHAIERRLQALADADGRARTPEAKWQRALLVLDMWRDQRADGVRDPALEEELDMEYEAIAAHVPQSDRLSAEA